MQTEKTMRVTSVREISVMQDAAAPTSSDVAPLGALWLVI
jgi:hypothetical protein